MARAGSVRPRRLRLGLDPATPVPQLLSLAHPPFALGPPQQQASVPFVGEGRLAIVLLSGGGEEAKLVEVHAVRCRARQQYRGLSLGVGREREAPLVAKRGSVGCCVVGGGGGSGGGLGGCKRQQLGGGKRQQRRRRLLSQSFGQCAASGKGGTLLSVGGVPALPGGDHPWLLRHEAARRVERGGLAAHLHVQGCCTTVCMQRMCTCTGQDGG